MAKSSHVHVLLWYSRQGSTKLRSPQSTLFFSPCNRKRKREKRKSYTSCHFESKPELWVEFLQQQPTYLNSLPFWWWGWLLQKAGQVCHPWPTFTGSPTVTLSIIFSPLPTPVLGWNIPYNWHTVELVGFLYIWRSCSWQLALSSCQYHQLGAGKDRKGA